MHFTSLKPKLIFSISILFTIFLSGLVAGTTYYSRLFAIDDAMVFAEETATAQSLRIKQEFETGFSAARSLAVTLAGLRAKGIMPTRDQATEMQHQLVKKNEQFFGIWSVWEPNAYNGDDSQYTSGTDHSGSDGRFIPYWNKTKGYLSLYPCKSYRDHENSAWYTHPRNTRREIATNVVEYHPVGRTIKVTSLAVPIMVNGKALGVIGTDLSADFLSTIVDSIEAFDGQATLTIIAPNGNVQARTNTPDALHKPYSEYVENASSLLSQVSSGQAVTSTTNDTIRVLVPMQPGNTIEKWAVALSIPKQVILAPVDTMTMGLIAGSVLAFLIAILFIYKLSSVIANPIILTSQTVTALASGNLEARCSVQSKDEIGTMQHAVNNLGETLERNEQRFKTNMEEIQTHSAEAREAMIAAEKAQQEAEHAHRSGQLTAAEQLGTVVETLGHVSRELYEQITSTASDVTIQSERNRELGTAMEEMNCTILEVAKNTNEAATNSDKVYEEATSGMKGISESIATVQDVHSHTEQLKQEMNVLGKEVAAISEIMNVINDIADQTNLLALNAAIEAARAGDAGRGFAVVADEVRKLAEHTMNATNQVSSAIENIQTSTNTNVALMNTTIDVVSNATQSIKESGSTFDLIMNSVTTASAQVRAIATATTQQSAASEEINQSIGEINNISAATSSRMDEAQKAMDNLTSLSNQLKEMIATLQSA